MKKIQRYFFEVAYLGTNYHGWQMQPNAITVQEVVSKGLSTILGSKTSVLGSGRTDTGVHCKQQFFHADISTDVNTTDLCYQLNAFLPYDISIASMRSVTDQAHARYDAIFRSYEYHINQQKDPFKKKLSYYFPKKLAIENMNVAATLLHGVSQDYESFSRVKTSVNNFICSISEAHWQEKDKTLIFHITANRFLRGMVRAIVGTLLDVGLGKITPNDVAKILISKDRKQAGRAAPAHGLYLSKVMYPKEVFIKNV